MRTKGERLSVKEEIRKEERKDAKIFLEKKKESWGLPIKGITGRSQGKRSREQRVEKLKGHVMKCLELKAFRRVYCV